MKLVEQGTLPQARARQSRDRSSRPPRRRSRPPRPSATAASSARPGPASSTTSPVEVGQAAFSMAGQGNRADRLARSRSSRWSRSRSASSPASSSAIAAEIRLVTGTDRDRQGPLHLQDREPDARAPIGSRSRSRMPTARFPDGITAEVAIPLAPVPATRVPRSALTFSSAGDLGVRIVDAANKVAFVPVSVVEDEQQFMWVGGIADGARVIVQGQDFVREGQDGRGRSAAPSAPKTAARSGNEAAMANPVDYAISHARLTIAALAVPARRGLRRLCDDPEGSRAGHQDPDHLHAADPARHQPGGRRAAAAQAGRDQAQVGRAT